MTNQMEPEKSDNLYELSGKQKQLTEDDVRIIVSQQLRSIIYPTVVTSGFLQSGNFVDGTSGWRLTPTSRSSASLMFRSLTLLVLGPSQRVARLLGLKRGVAVGLVVKARLVVQAVKEVEAAEALMLKRGSS